MDNNTQDIKQNTATTSDGQPATRRRGAWLLVAAVIGAVLTVMAWMALMYYPTASMWCAACGLVLSVAALWMGRSCWRDIAITSVVASGVLILVHVVFVWALDYALASL